MPVAAWGLGILATQQAVIFPRILYLSENLIWELIIHGGHVVLVEAPLLRPLRGGSKVTYPAINCCRGAGSRLLGAGLAGLHGVGPTFELRAAGNVALNKTRQDFCSFLALNQDHYCQSHPYHPFLNLMNRPFLAVQCQALSHNVRLIYPIQHCQRQSYNKCCAY